MPENKDAASMPVVRRMARYYRYLCELEKAGEKQISSKAFAEKLGLTASQVRQDFGCFGGFGHKGYGYVVSELRQEVQRILGLLDLKDCVLIGAGNLGRALLSVPFEQVGFCLTGVFDSNPELVGTAIKGHRILDYASLDAFCKEHPPEMAIICIPGTAVEAVAKALYALGVRAFWNFSHFDISVLLPDAAVENVHLNDSMMTLRYRMQS